MKKLSPRQIAAAALTLTITMAPAVAFAQATTTATTTTTTTATTTATSTDSVNAEIQSLLAEIHSLQQQLQQILAGQHTNSGSDTSTSTPPGLTGGCPTPNRDLGMGDQGGDVKDLQEFLAEHVPTVFASSSITGFFGPVTENAVRHFQEDNKIAPTGTGFFGPMTRDFVGKHCGELEGEGHQNGGNQMWTSSTTMQFDASSTFFGFFNQHHGDGKGDSGSNGSDN